MLDAPVSGRPPTMTMMIGGEREVFERVRDTLDAVAAQVFYVGPAGAGCVAKLATQYMGYTNLIAAIEGMLIARMGGVEPAVLAEIVPVSAGASRAFNAIPNSILDRSFAGWRHAGHRGQRRGPGLRPGRASGGSGRHRLSRRRPVQAGAG